MTGADHAAIAFRPLEREDMPLMHRWLQAPHMRRHYQPQELDLDEVTAKYLPRIEGTVATHCHIALLADAPLGMIQCYRNADFPDYSAEIVLAEGISLDIFIGEAARLGQGLGPRLLRAYIKEIAFKVFPEEARCYICHALDNPAAIRSSEKAGFRFLRDVEEAGKPAKLFVLPKEAL